MNNTNKSIQLKKNKKVAFAKLKTILCAPLKNTCPILSNVQLGKLQEILKDEIGKNADFCKDHKITLGLKSTLRAIQKKQARCVLLSQNLKPRYVLGLITRNSQVVDATVPIYAHSQLEEFCAELFGVRSLSVVFGKIESESTDLKQWIQNNLPATPVTELQDIKVNVPEEGCEEPSSKKRKIATEVVAELENEDDVNKLVATNRKITTPSSCDFISFGSHMDIDTKNQTTVLTNALKELSRKAKESKKNLYQPLTVHQMHQNPKRINKKTKNK